MDIDEKLLAQAIDTSCDGLTVVDARQPDLPLIYVNRGFEEMTGYSRGEVLGRNCRFLQGKDTDQLELERLRQALFRNEPCSLHIRNYRQDGSPFWNQLSLSPLLSADGEVTHFIGLQKDISNWVEDQENLRISNGELVKRNNEVQRFYHAVSHEIKTPLTAVREFISLVADGVVGDSVDRQKELLGHAIDGCDQISAHFNDLIDSTRLDTDKMTLRKSCESIDTIVVRSIATVAAVAAAKGVQLDQSVDSGLPEFEVDAGRIVQVVSNLLNNAVKHTASGGGIIVRARRSQGAESSLDIEVQDSGIGIKSCHLPHIFDRLYQVNANSDTFTGPGLGLGLSIARQIVQLHDGEILVDSEIGVGSVFCVRLPLPTSVTERNTREQTKREEIV